MKWNTIVSNAEKVKKSVEKDKKLPSVKGYNYAELLYLFAKAVRNPNKDIADKKVSVAPNPSGNNIEKNLSKDDYQKLAKYTIEWIDDRSVCPNYTTYGSYHIRPKLQLYCYSKIIVYYYEHSNTLPLTCWFKTKDITNTQSTSTNTNKSSQTSTSTNKKYGHATKSGCDNMGQNTDYYCGVHSLQEVIRNLYNIVVPQKTLASWAGTTTSGTSHQGLETAVIAFNKKYNKNLKVTWKNFSDIGWNGIKKVIDSKNQDCIIHNLYRNKWGHYEVINNVSSNITVQNSLGNYCSNGCHCGYIEYRTQSEFRSYINGISQKSIMVLTRG